MKGALRIAAAFLLAVLLPVQATAAACAQLCAIAAHSNAAHAHEMAAPAHADDPGDAHEDHCGKSGRAAEKCCQAHTLMGETAVVAAFVSIPSFEHHAFVARWTNFIPEEPSPPPIAFAPLA